MRSVLIAQNRAYQRRILQSSLERCGYLVSQASDGAAALAHAASEGPDVIVIDAELVSGDSRQICEQILASSPHKMPVICVLSQRIDAGSEALWSELPNTVMVEMPPSGRALYRQIEKHFGNMQDDS